jgi:hypothetical protein
MLSLFGRHFLLDTETLCRQRKCMYCSRFLERKSSVHFSWEHFFQIFIGRPFPFYLMPGVKMAAILTDIFVFYLNSAWPK